MWQSSSRCGQNQSSGTNFCPQMSMGYRGHQHIEHPRQAIPPPYPHIPSHDPRQRSKMVTGSA
ncbi:hypothetical protein GYMLUDRAFT_46590 [Collybiopsis luxurians FD-317 M1]|uniref:Uncharacterized protein n=1 Tax=Collybiopsis luxurians FD-317 M1 TaxID=944289 RepID=A0A0D0BPI7_9AGAR|nr:hypothetical protein GYMLUDRAFT_46590 [Collybiopsis luxurians FD-317 M1]